MKLSLQTLLLFGATLISAGCVSANYDGNKALVAAAGNGDLDRVNYLISAGFRDSGALKAAASGGHLDVVNVLIRARFPVNAKNGFGQTALSEATKLGRSDIVNVLKQAGAQ